MKNNEIFLYDYYAVIKSNSLDTDMHSHLANQITFSVNGEEFNVEVDGEDIKTNSIIIPSLVNHQFLDKTGEYLTILIDNESSKNTVDLLEIISKIDKLPKNKESIEELISTLGFERKSNLDLRVGKTLELVASTENLESIRLIDIAQNIGLSESRLLHLFKNEIGVPFRKYILWAKLKRFFNTLSTNNDLSLTDIAFKSGFSDSAHLSKVIKSSFGISPSEILKNSQFIKADD